MLSTTEPELLGYCDGMVLGLRERLQWGLWKARHLPGSEAGFRIAGEASDFTFGLAEVLRLHGLGLQQGLEAGGWRWG